MINKNDELMQYVEIFYNSESSIEDIKVAGEKIMLALYGQFNTDTTTSQYRVSRFLSIIGKSKTAINLASLPPTSAATYLHSCRTYYQVQYWLGNYHLNPEDWGWIKSETMYLPKKTTGKLAPDELLKLLHCNCIKDCTNRCGCKKAGLPCSPLCKYCKGEACSNCVKPTIDDDDENDEADVFIGSLQRRVESPHDNEEIDNYPMGVEYYEPVLEDQSKDTEEAERQESTEEIIDDEPPPVKRSKRLQRRSK